MPFGMAHAKGQIPKMTSGICDLKSGIPSARAESLPKKAFISSARKKTVAEILAVDRKHFPWVC
jgi:hypothetical protein